MHLKIGGSCAQFLFSGEIKLEFDMLTESSWEGWSSEQYNNGLFDLLKASLLFSKMNWNEKKSALLINSDCLTIVSVFN